MISYHFISYHLISSHFIPYHTIPYHTIHTLKVPLDDHWCETKLSICQPRSLPLRRLLHFKNGDPKFIFYVTRELADGSFQSTLRLSEKAKAWGRLQKMEYAGHKCSTEKESEMSAARVFWEDPFVLERAQKLEPSKKARRNKKRSAENRQRRKELYGYGTPEGLKLR